MQYLDAFLFVCKDPPGNILIEHKWPSMPSVKMSISIEDAKFLVRFLEKNIQEMEDETILP
jgi:hypothetical protein